MNNERRTYGNRSCATAQSNDGAVTFDQSQYAEIETSWTKAAVKGAPEGTFNITASAATPPPELSISQAELDAMPYDRRTAFLEAETAKARNNPSIPASLADPGRTKAQIEVKPGTPATLAIEINDYR